MNVDIWVDNEMTAITLDLPERAALRDALEKLTREHSGKMKPGAKILVNSWTKVEDNLDRLLGDENVIRVYNPSYQPPIPLEE